MRDRVDASTREVELLQEDVLYKVQVLDKMHQQYLQSLKGCTLVRDDISNCNQFLSKKMVRFFHLFKPVLYVAYWNL